MCVVAVTSVFVFVLMMVVTLSVFFFFQAEDGIRDLVRSRGLGDVYKRQEQRLTHELREGVSSIFREDELILEAQQQAIDERPCLLYTSDADDERSSVDLGGRRIIKKKNNRKNEGHE